MTGADQPKFIAIHSKEQNETLVHATSVDGQGDYDTMCGQDVDCDFADQYPADLPPHPKITCDVCALVIIAAKKYSLTDIHKDQRR